MELKFENDYDDDNWKVVVGESGRIIRRLDVWTFGRLDAWTLGRLDAFVARLPVKLSQIGLGLISPSNEALSMHVEYNCKPSSSREEKSD